MEEEIKEVLEIAKEQLKVSKELLDNTKAVEKHLREFKMMAHKPAFLEAQWKKINAVMREPGKLDPMTREVIAVAVSAVLGCDY